jgi:hypothetical protein
MAVPLFEEAVAPETPLPARKKYGVARILSTRNLYYSQPE